MIINAKIAVNQVKLSFLGPTIRPDASFAAAIKWKNFYQLILPCPDLSRTVCPDTATLPAAVPLLVKQPVVRGQAVAVEKVSHEDKRESGIVCLGKSKNLKSSIFDLF